MCLCCVACVRKVSGVRRVHGVWCVVCGGEREGERECRRVLVGGVYGCGGRVWWVHGVFGV